MRAFITGCSGTVLTPDERSFFADARPFGLILFARNCEDPDQVRALCAAFREAVGDDGAPVLIDQEGGRVRRLRPPHWPAYASAAVLGDLARTDAAAGRRAAWLHGRLIATDLRQVGIDVDCAPVLDIATTATTDAIGDRAFGTEAETVADLGGAVMEGLRAGGVLPVAKHIPGHGRATVDSHVDLPVVRAGLDELETDFAPFAELSYAAAMTAHIVYEAVDRFVPATASRAVIDGMIRERIGFQGLLLSDDISMSALSGDYGQRARRAYDAGCDLVLHCNGRTEEMHAIADAAPVLSGLPAERAAVALAERRAPSEFDTNMARAEYEDLLSRAGWPPPEPS